MKIDWDKIGSGERFETIVSVLLSTLNPNSERIDGSGGDGGRDHQFRIGDQLHLWQSKYFLKRLSESPSRKRQITKSLTVGAASRPARWTLVTPMVPTLTERAWFDGLQSSHPFPLVWRGGDWLDAQLAQHPAIFRHFMGAEEEYVALIRELKEEQEALVDGLPPALPRIEGLAAKLNDSNPFYSIDFTVQDGRVINSRLRPKYRGAEVDSPVKVQFSLVSGSAGAEMAEHLRTALEWGDAMELPASHVRNIVVTGPPGFDAAHDQADIVIGPAPHEPVDLRLRLVIRAPGGRQMAALPAQLITRKAAARGVTLHGRDLTGVVEVRLRLDRASSQFSLGMTCSWSRPLLPGAALPILRFLQHAAPPNTLSFEIGNVYGTTPLTLPTALAIPEVRVRLTEALDRVQTAAGDPFPVPIDLTIDDQIEIHRAVRLLDGEPIEIGWGAVDLTMGNPHSFIDAFARAQGSTLVCTNGSSYVAHVAGHDLDLGPCTFYVPQVQMDSSSITPNVDGTYQLRITAGSDLCIQVALGGLGELAGSQQDNPATSW